METWKTIAIYELANIFFLYTVTVVLYGEITEQLVYGKDIRKMRDLTTDVMRNPTFT